MVYSSGLELHISISKYTSYDLQSWYYYTGRPPTICTKCGALAGAAVGTDVCTPRIELGALRLEPQWAFF